MKSPIILLNKKNKKTMIEINILLNNWKNYIFVEFTKSIRDFGPRYNLREKYMAYALVKFYKDKITRIRANPDL